MSTEPVKIPVLEGQTAIEDVLEPDEGAIKAKAREIFEARYPRGAWSLVRGNDRKHYIHRARQALTEGGDNGLHEEALPIS